MISFSILDNQLYSLKLGRYPSGPFRSRPGHHHGTHAGHLLYKETLFFVLHEELARRIRLRACAWHVAVQMSGPQMHGRYHTWLKVGPFEVQTTVEERMGSK
jgi:hypothetical protein